MAMILRFQLRTMNKSVSLLKRAFAFLIDLYVGSLLATLPITFISLWTIQEMSQNVFLLEKGIAVIALICSIIILVCYYVYIPLHVYQGQTLGKHLLDITIVAKHKQDLCKRQCLVMLIFTSTSKLCSQLISILIGINIVSIVTECTLYGSIVCIIIVLVSKQHQMPYEQFANTTLINRVQERGAKNYG